MHFLFSKLTKNFRGFLFVLYFAPPAHAIEQFGVGIGIGDISGVSLYGKLDERHFGQGLVAFADEMRSFAISGDYGVAFPGALKELPIITPYYGFGGMIVKYPRWVRYRASLERESAVAVGGRIPLGAQMLIPETPLQLSLEVIPGILIVPATIVFLDALFAVRVVF